MCFQPVQCIERLLAALHVALEWLLLRVPSHVDPEAVRGEAGLATAFLIADKRVLSSASLLVGAQVASCAVGAWTALTGALVLLHFLLFCVWTFGLLCECGTLVVSGHGR